MDLCNSRLVGRGVVLVQDKRSELLGRFSSHCSEKVGAKYQ